MSDIEETEVQTNPIEDLIQAATSQDYTAASDIFSAIMGEKMSNALEQEKIAVAGQIYNGEEPDEEIELDDVMTDDEDLEDIDDDEEVEEWPDNPLEGHLEDEE